MLNDDEKFENFLIIVMALIIAPILFVLVLVLGCALIYLLPFLIIGAIIWLMLYIKRHEKTTVTMGRIKLVKLPKPISEGIGSIAKTFLGLVVMLIYIFIMACIPFQLACLITLILIGYVCSIKAKMQ